MITPDPKPQDCCSPMCSVLARLQICIGSMTKADKRLNILDFDQNIEPHFKA